MFDSVTMFYSKLLFKIYLKLECIHTILISEFQVYSATVYCMLKCGFKSLTERPLNFFNLNKGWIVEV